eukprot:TRINITY_DN11751_c0_g2_i1.p1 TRINITY_DN11751_c0_g2~~TRINITY_DN11751_c0_g2_i1.p1  ORF type:complete len:118 (-),score=2.94 TRINITY_DN11751_c0_g2_i1:257-610(-)
MREGFHIHASAKAMCPVLSFCDVLSVLNEGDVYDTTPAGRTRISGRVRIYLQTSLMISKYFFERLFAPTQESPGNGGHWPGFFMPLATSSLDSPPSVVINVIRAFLTPNNASLSLNV